MNLSKLNYILIPKTKEERERFQKSVSSKVFRLILKVYFGFSHEGRILLFIWILGSILSVNIGFTQYYVVWSVITGLLVGSVLLRRTVKLTDVQMTLQGPSRVTLDDEVHLTVTLENQGSQTHQGIRTERPFLSWDGKYLSPRLFVEKLGPGETVRLTILARFIARGEHQLGTVMAMALSPLGFALGPPIESEGLQFLVIPRIANVVRVNIDRTQKYQPGGVALASVTGESREIVGVRPYRPGDPLRDLHAKTWARTGFPVVREYQQEYFTRIGIIIDTEGGVADEPDFESMLSLAAGIVAQLSRGEALLDLLVIGDDIHQLTLGRSLGFLDQALDLLACVEPQEDFEAEGLQTRLSLHLSRLSSVIFIGLQWDDSRRQFIDWIGLQGLRCKTINVYEKKEDPAAIQAGLLSIKAADIKGDKELIL